MLQSPRIAQAGQSAMHQAIATALEANVVQIDVEEWAAAIGGGAAAANRADVMNLIQQIAAMAPEAMPVD